MVGKNILFIFCSISFLLGVFINNIFGTLFFSFGVLLLLVVLFLNYYIYTKKHISILFIIVLGWSLGVCISYINFNIIQAKDNIISQYSDNKNHILEVKIKNISKVNEFDQEYLSQVLAIDGDVYQEDINALIIIPKNLTPLNGATISLSSKIYPFKNSESFQYKEYMISKNIYFKTYANSYEILEIGKQNIIISSIQKFRNNILDTIKNIYPGEEGIFLGGILIGAREQLPESLKTDFNKSGLTHFIAVSGFNITILIIFLSVILKYFPSWIKLLSITIFIISFTLLVGFSAPVIRASIMGLIGYYVIMSGRKGDVLSIILSTAVIMTIISPYSLNYDISLHLSFLAVLGIIYTQDILKKIFYFLPETFSIKEAFIMTLGALSFTLPIMIFNFGQLSLLSPLSNIAVAWTIPIAMLLGFISIIVYSIFPLGGIIIGFFTWILLKFDILIVHLFGKADFAILNIDVGIYGNIGTIIYILIMIFLILYFGEEKEIKN